MYASSSFGSTRMAILMLSAVTFFTNSSWMSPKSNSESFITVQAKVSFVLHCPPAICQHDSLPGMRKTRCHFNHLWRKFSITLRSERHCPCTVGTTYFVSTPDCPVDRTEQQYLKIPNSAWHQIVRGNIVPTILFKISDRAVWRKECVLSGTMS